MIIGILDAEKWPCGCWQIVGHSVLHLCGEHQCACPNPEYWRVTPTVPVKLRVLSLSE